MLQVINYDDNSITNTQNEIDYIHSLCKETNKVLSKICKDHPDIIKNSAFVFSDRSLSNFGINTEAWHCISITPAAILNIPKQYRNVIFNLIISNVKEVISQYNLVNNVIYGRTYLLP
jgi:hypothetical protein